jgi:hypothetical protein
MSDNRNHNNHNHNYDYPDEPGKSNPKVIGFCGAGGVGKTTTALMLTTYLKPYGYGFLPSSSRSVFAAMGISSEADQHSLSDTKRWALQKNIQLAHNRKILESRGKNLICDRTQLDQFCYALQYCSTYLDESKINWLLDLTSDAMSRFDMIFYFPLCTWPDTDDGMRTPLPGPRVMFDFLLQGVLTDLGRSYYVVPATDTTSRCALILKVMAQRGFIDPCKLDQEMFNLISPQVGGYNG